MKIHQEKQKTNRNFERNTYSILLSVLNEVKIII